MRGGVGSIPLAQWESAESLAFTRRHTMWMIILPQAVKRMAPPWMNLYAILTIATTLISVVGIQDGLTVTRAALVAESRPELMMPMYLLLLMFFAYCYPIALATMALERRFQVKGREWRPSIVSAIPSSSSTRRKKLRRDAGASACRHDGTARREGLHHRPSGSGKSTLLRCINALTPIDKGTIAVAGREVHDPALDKLALRRDVGIVFQQHNLFPHRTVLQNVMMAPLHVLKQDKAEVEARARRLLDKVGLSAKLAAYPGELSGGQQQRVAIARSLAMGPKVMLFDEVTAALDPETKKEVLVTIRDLAAEGMTCILVTHEMGFAREVADHVYFIGGGVIVEDGAPDAFFAAPREARTRAFLEQVL